VGYGFGSDPLKHYDAELSARGTTSVGSNNSSQIEAIACFGSFGILVGE
jgi:hypothetical protein